MIEQPEDAAPLAEALAAGCLAAVEIALRTPRALDTIRAMKRAWPASLPGAGTVLTPGQAEAARSTGRSSPAWPRPPKPRLRLGSAAGC